LSWSNVGVVNGSGKSTSQRQNLLERFFRDRFNRPHCGKALAELHPPEPFLIS
jgi:hypothetical protein